MSRSIPKAVLVVAVVLWASAPVPSLACSTCFGQSDGPMIDGARVGTFLLLGVVFAVQAAFAAFFLYLRRQAARSGQSADKGRHPWAESTPPRTGEWRSA